MLTLVVPAHGIIIREWELILGVLRLVVPAQGIITGTLELILCNKMYFFLNHIHFF